MRLLLVEDDTDLTQSLRPALERAGFAVDPSADGVDAEFRGDSEPYDVAVLDLGLPKRSGLDVLRNWRVRDNDVPVIILTARDAWHDGLTACARVPMIISVSLFTPRSSSRASVPSCGVGTAGQVPI